MKFYQTALTLLVSFNMLVACSDDDWKDDVSALQKPVPSGIVMLGDAGGTVVKGNTFQLHFRVNPSGVSLAEDDVKLDVQGSETYLLKVSDESASLQTRASYVESSDCYELVSVEPEKNDAGETLDGQWVATVQTKGEGNYRNVADLHLVVDYTDAAGRVQEVSSPAVPVEIIPTVDEGLDFGYSGVQTFRSSDGSVNPYYLFCYVNTYEAPSGEEWHYSWDYVNRVQVERPETVMAVDTTMFYDKHYVTVTPDDLSSKWQPLDSGEAKMASDTASVRLVDVGGTEKTLRLPLTYAPSAITLDIELPASEINAAFDAGTKVYDCDLSGALRECGFTEDMLSRLLRFSVSPVVHISARELPARAKLNGLDKDNFSPVLSFTFWRKVTPGFVSEEGKFYIDLAVGSVPQGVDSELLYPIVMRINLNISVTD